MKNIFYFFTITLLFISCQGQTAKHIHTLDVKSYAEKIKTTSNAQILDVRTPDEYNVHHLENATNVNWNGDDFVTNAITYNKSKPIFVYCKVGGRSAQAANKLSEMGFKEIYNLDGGIVKWSAAGMKKSTKK